MSMFIALCRIGRDAELRYTTGNDPVITLSLATHYGKAGEDGKRPTQWIEATMWGARAEKLAPMLTKGNTIMATIEDLHLETYPKKDGGEGVKMVGRIGQVEFASSKEAGHAAPSPAPRQQQAQSQGGYRSSEPRRAPASKPAPKTGTGFDDMDDDIPF